MSTDFRDAAKRHFDDGALLQAHNRLANADHLYGICAECALKAIMKGLGMHTTRGGAPTDRAHKVHMPEIWMAFQSFTEGRLGSRYLEMIPHNNPFDDWKIEQRYSASNAITSCVATAHQDGANVCLASLTKALIDGVCR